MERIYKEDGLTIVITLRASETTDIRDYYGTLGSVSLRHAATGDRYNVAVFEDVQDTFEIPNDVYIAERAAAGLPEGHYAVQGSLTDEAGNRTVIGAVATPQPEDGLSTIEFELFDRRVRKWYRVRSYDRSDKYATHDRSVRYTSREF